MNLLIIHNRYKNTGGEDISVEQEVELLKKHYVVEVLYFNNNLNNIFSTVLSFFKISNYWSNRQVRRKIRIFKPDVVYVHNTWFKASLGIFKILEKKGLKTIVKLHNFRYHCTSTHSARKHLKGEKACQACSFQYTKGKRYNKYFPESYIKSFIVNVYGTKFLKIIKKDFISLIVLTRFHKNFIEENNYKKKNIYVLHNHINSKDIDVRKSSNYFVYAGRISKDKGIEELIKTFMSSPRSEVDLKVIGEGPLLNYLQKKYDNKQINFLGSLPNYEVNQIIANSIAVISATKLFEGQPTILFGAANHSVPSIFPDSGGISEFFPDEYPLLFEQFNYVDLDRKITLLQKDSTLKILGSSIKEHIEKNYSKDLYLNKIRKIFHNEPK